MLRRTGSSWLVISLLSVRTHQRSDRMEKHHNPSSMIVRQLMRIKMSTDELNIYKS